MNQDEEERRAKRGGDDANAQLCRLDDRPSHEVGG
jgi:hypothetical protein